MEDRQISTDVKIHMATERKLRATEDHVHMLKMALADVIVDPCPHKTWTAARLLSDDDLVKARERMKAEK